MKTRTKTIFLWTRYALIAIGLILLNYFIIAMRDSRKYQMDQDAQLRRDIKESVETLGIAEFEKPILPDAASPRVARTNMSPIAETSPANSPMARLDIIAIGLTAMVLEGVDDATLRHAIGHLPGSSLPGQKGNIVIAGHRDTFFRGLRNIHKGDRITLTSLKGVYDYRVDLIRIVDPGDADVLYESDDAKLTLITCYPFYYVGPAPQRFVVAAHRIAG